MNHPFSNRKKATIAIALIAIIAVSSGIYLQNNSTTQAALINPHPGLVGWWSFNEGSGTVAGDNSGNGNIGTINSAAWVDGKYGKALDFTADGSSIIVPQSNAISLANSLSLSCWIKGVFTNSWFDFLKKGYNYCFTVGSNGRVGFQIYDGTNNPLVRGGSNPAVNDGQWHNIVGVRDTAAHKLRLYVDGSLVDQVTATTTGSIQNTADFVIGANSLNSIIDEVRIYNYALSQTEIQADFKGGPDFSANVLVKAPQGTTQVITTLSWQGNGNINVTLRSPAQNYTENMLPEYQKSSYSTSNGITSILNIKRLSVSVTALPSDQNWYIALTLDNVDDYQITVEAQK
jgi:hypothetical protein